MNRVDHQISTESLLATVEFRASGGAVISKWIVTGIGSDNFPSLALAMSLPMRATSESESIEEANQLFSSYLEPLALKSLSNGGLSRSSEKVTDPSNPAFHVHALFFQTYLDNRLTASETFMTAGLYRLAKLLEVKKPIDFLTSFLRLPESTINRRLTKARDTGLIAKRSEEQNG